MPSSIFPHQDCDDRPAPLSAFQLPPPLDNPDPNGGDAATPEGPNSASAVLRGASNLSPTPLCISATPPVVIIVVTVIIILVIGTKPSTSSLHVGQPITRGPVNVDVAVGVAVVELFDFLSVPPPRGWQRGHRQEWLLLPPAPVLAAIANNDDNKDGCIIVKETREKTHLLHLLSRWSLPLYKARAGAQQGR